MKISKLLMMFAAAVLAVGCGGDDPNDVGGGDQPTVPNVVSVTPANGAKDIAVGDVTIDVKYDQNITLTSTDVAKVQIAGGTVKSLKSSARTLTIKANCPDEGTTVAVTIPAGLVKNTTAAYSFSFTTYKTPEVNITKSLVAGQTQQVKDLYDYFLGLYGKKVISSVMADVNWNTKIADKVKALTGKYPAMNCFDFIHIYVPNQGSNGWINYNDITPVKNWADKGGIVQLMWHFNVPTSENTEVKMDGSGVACDPTKTTFKASNALKEGTWENKWFYQEMDKVAAVLLKLQDAGIAATWRPFHEGAGNATLKSGADWGKAWFWWGAEGSANYKKLWIAMFDYFKQKGVKNLIWIWTSQNFNGDATKFNQDNDWYPGDQYVDMVARDLYGYSVEKNKQEFTELQAAYPTKMIVLGECGKGDNGEQGNIGNCWTAGAKWGHFMVWYQGKQGSTDTMCSDAWWKSAMSDSNVVTLPTNH